MPHPVALQSKPHPPAADQINTATDLTDRERPKPFNRFSTIGTPVEDGFAEGPHNRLPPRQA